ncbi:MAG: hypothetical protein LBL21_02190 [Rickettsiales bacterium]|jgi:hypothetical protein|nr:hypothetical protein [Rickettsiales bacterium]
MPVKYNFEEAIGARATDRGDCSGCCFINSELFCRQMTCWNDKYNRVFWTLERGTESELPDIWDELRKSGKNLKDICLAKIEAAHGP